MRPGLGQGRPRRDASDGIGWISVTVGRRVKDMEYRQLGRSGLRVSVLTLGTMTFGGAGGFSAVGATDVEGARRQVDLCLDAGVNLIDTADVYSRGLAEEITGEVIKGRRDALLLSTKVRMTMGPGSNDAGLSRQHIIAGCEASLRRLGTDHIDIYHVHEWDGQTRLEETMSALNSLVDAGKVSYLAASHYAGWQLMKALVVVGAPRAGGVVSGKSRRNAAPSGGTRQVPGPWHEPPVRDQEKLYDTVEV